LPTERDRYRRTLLEKCQSAEARPLTELVARANAAAARVSERYDVYLAGLLAKINVVARMRVSSWEPEGWAQFHRSIHDLKNSAAMAGENFLFESASRLENLLWRADRSDPQLDIVIRLFLSAIQAAADPSFDRNELDNMRGSLERISGLLGSIGWGSAKGPDS